jgi:psp operon transcriptional activator
VHVEDAKRVGLLLANHFAARMSYELGRDWEVQFSSRAVQQLESYGWQGNVRELKNVVERGVYKSDTNRIDYIDFDPFQSPYLPVMELPQGDEKEKSEKERTPTSPVQSFSSAIEQLEVELIAGALAKSRYNQRRAAELLGLTYDQFRGLYRKYREKLMVYQ